MPGAGLRPGAPPGRARHQAGRATRPCVRSGDALDQMVRSSGSKSTGTSGTSETEDSTVTNSPEAADSSAESITSSTRSEEHTSELQSRGHLVCRLLLEK